MAEKKNICVVFIRANTGLGKISRRLTSYPYTHIAVSPDEKLTRFYTYSRRRHYAPFDAGLMCEHRCHYIFGKYKDVDVRVYAIPADAAARRRVKAFIGDIRKDGAYLFNYFGTVLSPLSGGIRIEKAYNCMSFTAHLLEECCGITLPKPYWKMRLQEIEEALADHPHHDETLLPDEEEDKRYMDKRALLTAPFFLFLLTGRLLHRIVNKEAVTLPDRGCRRSRRWRRRRPSDWRGREIPPRRNI